MMITLKHFRKWRAEVIHLSFIHGAAGCFMGGQWGCLKDGSPAARCRGRAPVRFWGQSPQSWRHFLKIMH